MTVQEQTWDIQVTIPGEPQDRRTLEEELDGLIFMFSGIFGVCVPLWILTIIVDFNDRDLVHQIRKLTDPTSLLVSIQRLDKFLRARNT
jgi:hypothetical protein